MKNFRLLIVFSFILCCLLLLCSCDGSDALAKPSTPTVEPTTLTLNWRQIKDARMYTISITPESGEGWEETASKNS